ncbi:glycerophosphodiester phosphodiesterase [Sphaerisporangium perillae]|uniref:glycerophosphodiester phosphodiesterase n=1 Tax=Sphaerisporangium perillae TaxID=2935860 RepID=UPI00200C6E5D|nr:glycerophosphodiester phosphodiesterase [Sphaerisporangium perillae]
MTCLPWLAAGALAGVLSLVPGVASADLASDTSPATTFGTSPDPPSDMPSGVLPGTATLAGFGTVLSLGPYPVVIGHRGACAYRPEHTLLSYRTAIEMGADFIEPDLVSTKDHVLVARHENEISRTTDVARHPEFAARRTTKVIDGRNLTGWFTEDFTLAELRTLRAVERLPRLRPDSAAFDGLAPIATFDEIVALAKRAGVGVYPETKHSGYFTSIGLPLEEPLLATLGRYGWREKSDPVFIQSFETANLRALRGRTRLRLVQLLESSGAPRDLVAAGDPRTYRDLATPAGLAQIASYADAIGVPTRLVLPARRDGELRDPTTLVEDAHRQGLAIHVWTVRPENAYLPARFRQGDPAAPGYAAAHGDVTGWLRMLYGLGVDGVFTDDPGIARRTRDALTSGVGGPESGRDAAAEELSGLPGAPAEELSDLPGAPAEEPSWLSGAPADQTSASVSIGRSSSA